MKNQIELTEQHLLLVEAATAAFQPMEAEISSLQRQVDETEHKVSESNADRSLTIEARAEIGYRGAATIRALETDLRFLTDELRQKQDEAIKLGIGAYDILGGIRDYLRDEAIKAVTSKLADLVELHAMEYSALALRSRVVKELDAVAILFFIAANKVDGLANLFKLRPILNEYLSVANRHNLA